MKIGVDPPWYRESQVEREAFNLYAMHEEHKYDKVVEALVDYGIEHGSLPSDAQHKICAQFGFDLDTMSDEEIDKLSNKVVERLI